jgi:hypothetical protein
MALLTTEQPTSKSCFCCSAHSSNRSVSANASGETPKAAFHVLAATLRLRHRTLELPGDAGVCRRKLEADVASAGAVDACLMSWRIFAVSAPYTKLCANEEVATGVAPVQVPSRRPESFLRSIVLLVFHGSSRCSVYCQYEPKIINMLTDLN